MFSFDAIFSSDDSQAEVASSALADVVHAVVNGSDGCVFSFGHARLGKTQTMVGAASPAGALGVMPCALSWLFRAIADHKQRTGARFSVRVSAVEVCASIADLLAGHASESGGEPSPGSLLSDEPPLSEVRAPSAERAAALLEAALANRRHAASVLLFRLHVYQYHGRAVSAGRSRLHLLDLGGCKSQQGDLPPSALTNVLLAIINGNRHLPYREHKLSQLLRECLGSLTCHTTMIAHVSAAADHYTDTLATLQFASRVHRMRRLRVKFGLTGEPGHLQHTTGAGVGLDSGHSTSTGSSDVDPSSSEQSADTVIYLGPAADDATDGEHPPVYLPGAGLLRHRKMGVGGSGKDDSDGKLNRSATSHLSTAKPSASKTGSKSPNKVQPPPGASVDQASMTITSSPLPVQRKTSLQQHPCSPASAGGSAKSSAPTAEVSDERWIDGPRVSRSKLEEARSLIKSTHKKNEAWVDGPLHSSVTCNGGPDVPLRPTTPLTTSTISGSIYAGFAENQKKKMIKKWVESQTAQSQKQQIESQAPAPKAVVAAVEAVVTQQPRPTATKELLRLENGYMRDSGQGPTGRDPEVLESCYKASEYLAETMNIDYHNDPQFMSTRSATVCALSKVQEVLVSPVVSPPMCRAASLSRSASLFLETERTSKCLNGKDDALRKVNSLRVGKTAAANYVCDKVDPKDTCKSPDVYSRIKDFDLQGSEASAEDDIDVTRGAPEDCKTDSASLGSSSDADVEVEETCEIVQMQDSCLQVSEDDIARCMGTNTTRKHSAVGDHPPEILSQDNLSTSSSFTDSLSAATDPLPRYRGGGCWQAQQRPSSLYDEAEEAAGGLAAASDSLAVKRVVGGGCGGGGGGGGHAASEDRLQELARLHQMYKRKLASIWLAPASPHLTRQPPAPDSPTPPVPLAERPLPPPPPLRTPTLLAGLERPLPPPPSPMASRFQSASLCDVAFSDDGVYSDASIYSEPAISYADDTAQRRTKLCVNCKLSFSRRPSDNNLWLPTPTPTLEALVHPPLPPRRSSRSGGGSGGGGGGVDKQSGCSIASLRRPDGCSNPDLKEEADLPARVHRLLQGNGYLPKSFRLEEAAPPLPAPNRPPPATPPATPTPTSTPTPRLYRRLLGKVSARLPPVAARLGCGRLVDSCASQQRSRGAADADVDADADADGDSVAGVCRARSASTASSGGATGDLVAVHRQAAAPEATAPLVSQRVSVLEYCLEDVTRLERRWTERSARRLRRLRDQQVELKLELALTKARLLLPASRWDFDLHVEESMDARDPAFLEALQRETEILAKRVAAAKSRVMIVTCFDATPRCSSR